MPDSPIPERLLSQLLWRHFRWHLWVGLAIWTGIVLVGSILYYLKESHSDYYVRNPDAIGSLIGQQAYTTLLYILFGLIPATISGLTRRPFLAFLCRNARASQELVFKSLLLFGASVALLSLIPWPIAYNQFSMEMIRRQLLALSLFGLPWLITTGLASRKLAAALALPDKAN